MKPCGGFPLEQLERKEAGNWNYLTILQESLDAEAGQPIGKFGLKGGVALRELGKSDSAQPTATAGVYFLVYNYVYRIAAFSTRRKAAEAATVKIGIVS